MPAFGFADDLLKGGLEKPAGEGARAAEDDAAERSGRAPEPPEAAAERKVSLPAYGFAKELLQEKQVKEAESGGQEDETGGQEDKTGKKAKTGKKDKTAGPTGTAAAADSGEGAQEAGEAAAAEDRIFTFADGLEAGSVEAAPAAPVRLETWLSFSLAGETFGLPVSPVHEVVRPSTITRVPHAPFPIRGVTNLRGRVVPVIDLRLRLELPEGELTRASRIIVVGSRGRRLGLLVDAVHQVIHIDLDRVQRPPDDVMTVQSDYISGVYYLGDDLVLLLDVDRVLIIKDPETPAPAPIAEAGGRTGEVSRQGAA